MMVQPQTSMTRHDAEVTPARTGVLQRCSCGRTPGATGECAECRRKRKLGVQAKLVINEPGDRYEREADRVAEQVMLMPDDATAIRHQPEAMPHPQPRQDADGELIQTRAEAGTAYVGMEAPSVVHEVLSSPGRPLEAGTQRFMEARIGHDFSQVRVHTDVRAAASARAVGARAYTVGRDVVFGTGEYAPSTWAGRHLVAHELTHVVQQSDAPSSDSLRRKEPLVKHTGEHPQVMRSEIFASTLEICHQYLRSRTFSVSQDGLHVTVNADWGPEEEGAPMPHGCRADRPFSIELRDEGLLFDDPWGTCEFAAGGPSSRQWTSLPAGEYYLAINTPDTGPYCCLSGSIEVSEERNLSGDTCTRPPPGPLEILHTALDIAGLVPALGAVADSANAGIYMIEGDWVNAGISAAGILPIFGAAATIGRVGTRTVARVSGEGIERAGRDRIANALRRARQLLRTMRVPRAVPFRGAASNLDPELVRLARDLRATQAGVSRQAFRSYNIATARVRVAGEVRYITSGNLPSGPHSEEWLHAQIAGLRRGNREVVVEQLYSERIPCRGTCGPLLNREYPNADIFYTTSADNAAARARELMEQYGLAD